MSNKRNAAPVATAQAQAVAKWIDDPHDIEQGQMLNPAWLKLHGVTAAEALAASPEAAPAAMEGSTKESPHPSITHRGHFDHKGNAVDWHLFGGPREGEPWVLGLMQQGRVFIGGVYNKELSGERCEQMVIGLEQELTEVRAELVEAKVQLKAAHKAATPAAPSAATDLAHELYAMAQGPRPIEDAVEAIATRLCFAAATPTPASTELRHALMWTAAALQALIASRGESGSINMIVSGEKKSLEDVLDLADAALAQPAPVQVPVSRESLVLVGSGALQMVVNALRRDAEEGKLARGEMVDALLASMHAAPVQQDAPQSGWAPIATVPTDDREFLVGGFDDAGRFHQAVSHNENPAVNSWRGWNHRNGPLDVRVTHWKPLDAPAPSMVGDAKGGA